MTLDKKLARLRKKAGLSQAEVSEELDVSRQAVTKWETGVSRPSVENLQSLSKLYNVPLEYLLDEKADELPATDSACPDTGDGTEQEGQEKKTLRIRRLMIGAVALVLLIGCFIWYERSQMKKDMDDLHTIQGEENTSLEVPEFSLNWE